MSGAHLHPRLVARLGTLCVKVVPPGACRVLMRLMPIDTVCHADLDSVTKVCKQLFPQHFPQDGPQIRVSPAGILLTPETAARWSAASWPCPALDTAMILDDRLPCRQDSCLLASKRACLSQEGCSTLIAVICSLPLFLRRGQAETSSSGMTP